jgi:hypothetical protein
LPFILQASLMFHQEVVLTLPPVHFVLSFQFLRYRVLPKTFPLSSAALNLGIYTFNSTPEKACSTIHYCSQHCVRKYSEVSQLLAKESWRYTDAQILPF